MEEPKPVVPSITIDFTDLIHVKMVLGQMVEALNAGPKSRARSLVVTKLEEASMWAGEGLRLERYPQVGAI